MIAPFRAFVVDQAADGFKVGIRHLEQRDLPPGDVLIQVAYAALNYKDALVCIPNGNVARTSPLVPGLELTGVVIESTDPRSHPGDRVLAFDFGSTQGVSRHGGYSEYARVASEILSREETEAESTRPLESERWAGSIDTVGGATLAYLMRTTKKGGAIAAIGVAGGAAFRATVSLRVLKGKRWKQLQRLTYPLALLAVAHTFGHQYLNLRGPVLLVMVIIPLVMVLACQGLGIVLTVSQQRRG